MCPMYGRRPVACNPPLVAWQKRGRRRSNNPQFCVGTDRRGASLRLTTYRGSESAMTDGQKDSPGKEAAVRRTLTPAPPERELELKLKKHPEDLDAKADVGSDESMDASDPSAATQPGGNDPAASSGFP